MTNQTEINIDAIQTGVVFKNHKEMCNILGMEFKNNTNSKKSQLKTLGQYCVYEKKGHSIIVKEVFSEKQDRIDSRGGRYTDVYNSLTQVALLEFLITVEKQDISISKTRLLEAISVINRNYVECREHLTNLSKYTGVSLDVIFEFYSITNSNFKSILESALNTLQDKALIKYHKIIKIKEIDTLSTRIATPEDLSVITETENEILKQMEYENIRAVRMSKNWKLFKEKVSKLLKDKNSNIEYYYSAYDIGMVSNEKLEEAIDDVWNNVEKYSTLNNVIQLNLKKKAIDRYEFAISDYTNKKKSTRYRKFPNYLIEYNTLVDNLILEDAEDIYYNVLKLEQ